MNLSLSLAGTVWTALQRFHMPARRLRPSQVLVPRLTPVARSGCEPRVTPRRPLRVLRVVDASQGSAQVGRMVISGCLADVCAELDRLAALETRRT